MRVSCACPADMATSTLVKNLEVMGLHPIQTSQVIRVVYEGPDTKLGEAIVELFAHEADHEITVFYDRKEQRKIDRKAERALRNAKLHGH